MKFHGFSIFGTVGKTSIFVTYQGTMKFLYTLLFLTFSSWLFAQSDIERFPVFEDCKGNTSKQLEDCFYSALYAQLKNSYQHPIKNDTLADQSVTIRFEVDRDGKFVLIRTDAFKSSLKEEMIKAFSKLPVIEAPTFNGDATFMQFILNVPVPMKESGSFKVYSNSQSKIDQQNEVKRKEDSLAFAKANEEYNTIISDQYDNHQLRSDAVIPLSYQRYHRYEAAMNRVGNNAHTAVKPYTFNYVDQYFDLEAERESLLKDRNTWLGRKWHNEHFFELAGEDYWVVIDPGVDLQVGKDSRDDVTTYNNTRLVNVSGGIGDQITFGASIQESQARFPGFFERDVISRAPDGGNPGIVPGRGIAEDGGDRIFDYPVATGYVNYKPSKYFDLQLGHGQHFIGDGYRSLVLSDNSQPFPYFKLNAKFWKLDYTVLYTSLRDVRPEVTADDSFRTKFMTHHYLSWNATKRLNLGFFESVLWQDDNQRGFDFNYLNPVIFYQTVELETGSRGGNALLGLTAKYKVSDKVTAYGQLVLDEFSGGSVVSGNGSYQNKSAYQLGVKWQNAFKLPNLMMQLEYNRVRPYTYSHNTVVLNYGNSNQALAHPWGANFYETVLIGRYTKDRWYGIAKAIYGERGYDVLTDGDNAFYGGDIYGTEDDRISDNGNVTVQGNISNFFYGHLEAGYVINPASRLKVFGQVIYRSSNPIINNSVVRGESTTWLNLGLRTDIMNWSFDR
ncbi:gliding motility protein RemB [Nonlabens sp. Asnod3-A02]|uniref:gliding motility protein RemB n=1 Tax=Nonlabens sp. Asnod3-A02 TaxID=3160579 RepID=UPI003866647B